MPSTSPNFHLTLASTDDLVDVAAHVAAPLSTIDAVLAVVHTGTGQLKAGLTFTNPVLIAPAVSGTLSSNILAASTGIFNTLIATSGSLAVGSISIGNYSMPIALGTNSQILTVSSGNVVWANATPNTGADQALDNLTTIAFNTNLNTFTAGFVTVTRIIATSGALTGLTAFRASTGTFTGNVTVTGTLTANVVNCTGGAITAGGVTVGTWALPSTLGATNSVLRSLASTASWAALPMTLQTAFSVYNVVATTVFTSTFQALAFASEIYDGGNNVTTGAFTAPASGLWEFDYSMTFVKVATTASDLTVGIRINTTNYALNVLPLATAAGAVYNLYGSIANTVTSGAVIVVYASISNPNGNWTVNTDTGTTVGLFKGKRLFEA